MISIFAVTILLGAAEEPFLQTQILFEPEENCHTHASCIVECPNGDLRAVWYENGPRLPEPYFSKEGDKSADVRIAGARKPAGAQDWETKFVMADTFGVSDNNPCMTIDREGRLWLVYATLLAVPARAWESGLLRYAVSSDYGGPGVPVWERQDILAIHPQGFEDAILAGRAGGRRMSLSESQRAKRLELARKRLEDPFEMRLGWMPRAHPLTRSDGAILLPVANENFYIAAMAITRDGGATWTVGKAVPATDLSQPTVVEFPDGRMLAFFRNGSSAHRILRSESHDGGLTWGPVEKTDLPHPDAGIEAILLKNGHLALIYNDREDRRDRLAVSISEDGGKSWAYTRHLEDASGQRFDYPSLIQGKDGTLHATYSLNVHTIKYAHFNEAWVREK